MQNLAIPSDGIKVMGQPDRLPEAYPAIWDARSFRAMAPLDGAHSVLMIARGLLHANRPA